MDSKVKKIISVCLILIAIGIGVLCYFVLPDNVTMQIGADGAAGSSMPKMLAIILPLVISVFGALISFKQNTTYAAKSYVCAVAGIIVMVLELIFN